MSEIRNLLIYWYAQNKRQLPWREQFDPYKIWLSEIILQQTRVNQGYQYFIKITDAFPNIQALASASENEVLKLWQGLGYYARARNMHFAAKQVVDQYNGIFPNSYNQLLTLKGVGQYTAAAIASMAFNEPVAVVDGNVYRVLARVFGIETPINSTNGKSVFQEIANKLLDRAQPGIFNQAIMEFGALWCTPASPNCDDCILASFCEAKNKNSVNKLPVKLPKEKVKVRYLYYMVLFDNNQIVINKRTKNDIWKGLYDFPIIETSTELTEQELINNYFSDFFNNEKIKIVEISEQYTHKLTHRLLIARFYSIQTRFAPQDAIKIDISTLREYPMPRLIELFVNNIFL